MDLRRFRETVSCNIISDSDRIKSLIANGTINFVVSTLSFGPDLAVARSILTAALKHRVHYATTIAGALAALLAIQYKVDSSIQKL